MSAGFPALLKDMAVMSKAAAERTLAVVGDDLAISANQMIGGQSARKIPMVMQVVKGSLKNKAWLIPTALCFSYLAPALIVPALSVGGALLCFDSIDKILHKKLKAPQGPVSEAYANDHAAWERRHVKGALKTDLLLSAEITTVSMWTVAGMPLAVQLAALVTAGVAMTAAVYGVVATLIKLDDIGAALGRTPGRNLAAKALRACGRPVENIAPKIIKGVGILGTAAMFTVGGTMLLHGIPGAEALMAGALNAISSNVIVQTVIGLGAKTLTGIAAGFAAIPVARIAWPPLARAWDFAKKLRNKIRPSAAEPDDAEDCAPAPVAAPAPDAQKPALQAMPDVKADLNAAANDNRSDRPAPAQEAKALPALKKSGP